MPKTAKKKAKLTETHTHKGTKSLKAKQKQQSILGIKLKHASFPSTKDAETEHTYLLMHQL